ncbi:MAG: mechanosensitive ion channel family protein [Thomasclavelia sp.]|nr:mechanosensitive ion channel family protein [Thomasclavelia sp.]
MLEQLDKYFKNGFINGMISIVIVIIIMFFINKALKKYINKKYPENNNGYKRVVKIILVFITLGCIFNEITALSAIAKALLASGGILAVVIGLASQEAAGNLINGLMILTYKPFKVGDYVKIHSHNVSGKIVDISLRDTKIETLERTQIIVPNTIMNKAVVENISKVDAQKANHLFVDISYEDDINKAIEIIQRISEAHPLSVDGRKKADIKKGVDKVAVHVTEFKDSGVTLRATIYSKDNITGFQLLSDLRKEVLTEFDKAGIVIPYPHQEVIISNKNK